MILYIYYIIVEIDCVFLFVFILLLLCGESMESIDITTRTCVKRSDNSRHKIMRTAQRHASASASASVSLTSLPDELLTWIVTWLYMSDPRYPYTNKYLARVTCTCRALRKAVASIVNKIVLFHSDASLSVASDHDPAAALVKRGPSRMMPQVLSHGECMSSPSPNAVYDVAGLMPTSSLPMSMTVGVRWKASHLTLDRDCESLRSVSAQVQDFFRTFPNVRPTGMLKIMIEGDIHPLGALVMLLTHRRDISLLDFAEKSLRFYGGGMWVPIPPEDVSSLRQLSSQHVVLRQTVAAQQAATQNGTRFPDVIDIHLTPSTFDVNSFLYSAKYVGDLRILKLRFLPGEYFLPMFPGPNSSLMLCNLFTYFPRLVAIDLTGAEHLNYHTIKNVFFPTCNRFARILSLDNLVIEPNSLVDFLVTTTDRCDYRLIVTKRLSVHISCSTSDRSDTEHEARNVVVYEDVELRRLSAALAASDAVFRPGMTFEITFVSDGDDQRPLQPRYLLHALACFANANQTRVDNISKLRLNLNANRVLKPTRYYGDIVRVVTRCLPHVDTLFVQQAYASDVDADVDVEDDIIDKHLTEEEAFGDTSAHNNRLTRVDFESARPSHCSRVCLFKK